MAPLTISEETICPACLDRFPRGTVSIDFPTCPECYSEALTIDVRPFRAFLQGLTIGDIEQMRDTWAKQEGLTPSYKTLVAQRILTLLELRRSTAIQGSADLCIAEICFPSGAVRDRYSRYMSEDGARWIRHGLFRAYYEDGTLASEGTYEHGKEHGPWRDYHSNGRLAADGSYEHGEEVGKWSYWNPEGIPQ